MNLLKGLATVTVSRVTSVAGTTTMRVTRKGSKRQLQTRIRVRRRVIIRFATKASTRFTARVPTRASIHQINSSSFSGSVL